jgi:hypothetical protein
MSKKVKIIVIVVLVICVIIGAISYFGNNAPVASTSGLTSSAGPITALPGGGGAIVPDQNGSNFAALLSSVNTINLDTSIFSDPAYKALRDYPLSLGTAIIGRQNPFAPIGTDSTSGAAGSLQVQTLAPGKVLSTSAEFDALVTTTTTDPTTVVFQYGLDDTFGSATTPTAVTKSGTALFTATGLTPSTTYYVEAVAVQGSSTATGSIMTFTTAAAAQKH